MPETVLAGEAVAGQSKQLRHKAEKLIKLIDVSQYDLAEVLFQIQDSGAYTSWGFNTYSEFIATTTLKPSKGRYLPQIARVMQQLSVSREQYEKIGIAKLRVIASLNPDGVYKTPKGEEHSVKVYMLDMVNTCIEKGENYPINEVKKHARILKGLTGDRDVTYLGVPILRLALENVVNPAFEKARMLIGSVGKDSDGNAVDASDGTVLERICAAFLTIPDSQFEMTTEIGELDDTDDNS